MKNRKGETGMRKEIRKEIAVLVEEMRPVYIKEKARLEKQLAKLEMRYEKIRSVGVGNYAQVDMEELNILGDAIDNSQKRIYALEREWQDFQKGIVSNKDTKTHFEK